MPRTVSRPPNAGPNGDAPGRLSGGLRRGIGAIVVPRHQKKPTKRREWDSNLRYPEGTTVFETVRFGHSRIPPAASLLLYIRPLLRPSQKLSAGPAAWPLHRI